ncbi:MAG: primosomal protein N' [Cyanosarcina radialis HA8281-LM2]|jgi:primosomal protein N' (replication factor Y)|nr:primosomal protein N' [Cyanosarcina radialis HA8281-LM2]
MLNASLGLLGLVAEPKAPYEVGSTPEPFIEVLVDCPGAEEKLYTYRVPSDLRVLPGDILSVPFGATQVGAIAVRQLTHLPPNLAGLQIKEVEDVICAGFFPTSYWQLIDLVATYYYTPLIKVLGVGLPPGLLERSQRRLRLVRGDGEMGRWGDGEMGRGRGFKIPPGAEVFLSPVARQILQLLRAQPNGDYSFAYLQRQVRGASRGVRELLRRGWVESYLEHPKPAKPKLKQAVTLVSDSWPIDLTARQREILEVLRRHGGDLWLTELVEICHTSSSTLKLLEEKGCIVIQQREVLRIETHPDLASEQPKSLTPAQGEALAAINAIEGFAKVLLHGVTGSGKTEVYLQAIAPILERGQSALVLVPEIGLTPQLTDRFRARFGNQVCVYHSALSDGERYDTWRQMLAGEPQVVIGTRSAVFAPLPQLGLIVLDEEHDSSFKQEQPVPTYHARKVATWRAELEKCPLILGSATPSLETWVSVREGDGERGRWGDGENLLTQHSTLNTQHSTLYLSLPERIQSRPLPPVEVVDMRQELQQGNRSIFSRSLQEALQQLKEREQQGILFIHRRGHSTFVSCRSCGYVLECPHCDVSLTYHHTHEEASELLRCHYCNFFRAHPNSCPECGSPYLKFFGSGTQKVAEELAKHHPDLRFIRFDSDTTRTKGAHRRLLTSFANGEADLLIGTQMLTKGLDLPQVTLVGVVAADGLLHLPDYRASERAFQTLTQVAGRSGRGDDPGRVIIQTYNPDREAIQAVKKHDYESFVATELQQRAELNYPPYGRLLLLRLSSSNAVEVEAAAELLAARLEPTEPAKYEVLGPAPASIMRVANRYRWQILLKFPGDVAFESPELAEVLNAIADRHKSLLSSSVSFSIDVDPLNLM